MSQLQRIIRSLKQKVRRDKEDPKEITEVVEEGVKEEEEVREEEMAEIMTKEDTTKSQATNQNMKTNNKKFDNLQAKIAVIPNQKPGNLKDKKFESLFRMDLLLSESQN